MHHPSNTNPAHSSDYYYYSDSEEQHKYSYSRSDFRDQYCISDRNLSAALERSKSTNYLFSCIGSYNNGAGQERGSSPCKRGGSNPFTSCYSSRYEEEELESRRRRRKLTSGAGTQTGGGGAGGSRRHLDFDSHHSSDTEGGFSTSRSYHQHYIKRPPQRYYDRRYVWNEELERYIECNQRKLTRYTSVPLQRCKHVSFDQDRWERGDKGGGIGSTSLERLIEYGAQLPLQQLQRPTTPTSTLNTTLQALPNIYQQYIHRPITPLLSSIHRTQSTQTEESPLVGRRPTAVSQAAQTNGGPQPHPQSIPPKIQTNPPGRKLEKTYSDGEILLERRKALKTSFQDVQLNQKREPYLFKYKIDETFHERFISNGHLRDSFETSSRLQTSDEEETSLGSSSDAGSYALPPLPPSPSSGGVDDDVRISPPEGFGNENGAGGGGGNGASAGGKKKKRSFRSKSEETSVEESKQVYRSWHGDLDNIHLKEDELWGLFYVDPLLGVNWSPITELLESLVWRTHSPVSIPLQELCRSEVEFYKKFTATTHRLVHRKASAEVYKRLGENRLEITSRTTVNRTHSHNNEFGFRIHGSRPVVVSAVEKSTPASASNLRVGDVLITLNGIQVLDSSHSHVVQIANVDLLEMELCSTSLYFNWDHVQEEAHYWEGTIWRKHTSNGTERWGRRHSHLSPTSLQIYYTTDYNTLIELLPIYSPLQLPSFILESIVVYPLQYGDGMLAFESVDERNVFTRGVAMVTSGGGGVGAAGPSRVHQPGHLLSKLLPPLCTPYSLLASLPYPDKTSGPVYYFSRVNKLWTRFEAVLYACTIYFYKSPLESDSEEGAVGASCLHGYKIQISNTMVGGRRWIFQCCEGVGQQQGGGNGQGSRDGTPKSQQQQQQQQQGKRKDYFLAVETETERKRWLAALEYSIDRWIQIV